MKNGISEHSLLKSATLHLLPGLLIGGCYFALAPVVKANGFPSVMALLLAGIFVLIPFELGFLIFQKRQPDKSFLTESYYTLIKFLLGNTLSLFQQFLS